MVGAAMTETATCSPGSHPHSDRPNWRPAETIEEYAQNCKEGLEQFSDRRAAKLLGWPRIMVYRAMLISELPDDLFERLLHCPGKVPSPKTLAQIALSLRDGNRIAEVERCPHCGGVVRERPLVGNKLVAIVNQWIDEQEKAAATTTAHSASQRTCYTRDQ
jgi:hypothetical protein